MSALFLRTGPDGITLSVKVQPKSRRPGIQDASGPVLRIGVTEAAEDGRANEAVRALLAKVLDVPISQVTIRLGHGRREKTVHVTGDAARLNLLVQALAV